jgi:hypothetical protein
MHRERERERERERRKEIVQVPHGVAITKDSCRETEEPRREDPYGEQKERFSRILRETQMGG